MWNALKGCDNKNDGSVKTFLSYENIKIFIIEQIQKYFPIIVLLVNALVDIMANCIV